MMNDNITLYESSVPQMYDTEVSGIAVAKVLKASLHTAKQHNLPANTLFFVERSAVFPIVLIAWLLFGAYILVADALAKRIFALVRGVVNRIKERNESS
jgi:hypothetical protein